MHARSNPVDPTASEDEDGLTISPEKVCLVIVKAREFDAKDAVTEPDPGSNPADDKDIAVLEDHADDPVVEELTAFVDALSEDEQIDLVPLAWLGREDYSASDWLEVREEAARAHNERTASTFSERHFWVISWKRPYRCSAVHIAEQSLVPLVRSAHLRPHDDPRRENHIRTTPSAAGFFSSLLVDCSDRKSPD